MGLIIWKLSGRSFAVTYQDCSQHSVSRPHHLSLYPHVVKDVLAVIPYRLSSDPCRASPSMISVITGLEKYGLEGSFVHAHAQGTSVDCRDCSRIWYLLNRFLSEMCVGKR